MLKFKRLHSSSHEFDLIVAGREKVLESSNGGDGGTEEWEDNIERDGPEGKIKTLHNNNFKQPIC